jgi:hypothetical protein
METKSAEVVTCHYEGKEVHYDVEHVEVHSTVTSIPQAAFKGRDKLRDIIFHGELGTLGMFTFCGCSALTRGGSLGLLAETVSVYCVCPITLEIPSDTDEEPMGYSLKLTKD